MHFPIESEASVEKNQCPNERISKEHRSFASPPHPPKLKLGLSYLGRAKRAVLVRAFILTAVQMFELKIVCSAREWKRALFLHHEEEKNRAYVVPSVCMRGLLSASEKKN